MKRGISQATRKIPAATTVAALEYLEYYKSRLVGGPYIALGNHT